jgi:hypothetical protein
MPAVFLRADQAPRYPSAVVAGPAGSRVRLRRRVAGVPYPAAARRSISRA